MDPTAPAAPPSAQTTSAAPAGQAQQSLSPPPPPPNPRGSNLFNPGNATSSSTATISPSDNRSRNLPPSGPKPAVNHHFNQRDSTDSLQPPTLSPSAPGTSMPASEQSPNPPAPGATDQFGRPNRPWSQSPPSPPPGHRFSQPFAYQPPSSNSTVRAGGEGDMGDNQSGGMSAGGYEGRRHSIASGEVVQGHNDHSHPTANARAGPPSNSAHLLSPYHDQYTSQAPQQRHALKRKLSHDHLPTGDSYSNGKPPANASGGYNNPPGGGMDVDSKADASPTSAHPNKRRGSAIDASRMAQMSIQERENSNPDSPSGPPPGIWAGGPPRWGSGPYPPHPPGAHGPPPPPPHVTDERRDSAASIFSATSMASSASGGGGYAPSTAPTSFSSNGGPEDPSRNYQSFMWPPAGGPPPPHGYGPPGPPYFGPPPSGQFPGGPPGPASPGGERRPSTGGEDDSPPPVGTPNNSNPGAGDGENDITPTSALGSGSKDTPYSRSPELRVSHKLAERKRRKEMKDLFDELRDQLPADRGMKASKWEILSKAVEYIASMKTLIKDQARDVEHLRHEMELMHSGVAGAHGVPPPGPHMHGGPPPHMMGMPPPHGFYRPQPPPGVGPPPPVFGRGGTPPRERDEGEERQ